MKEPKHESLTAISLTSLPDPESPPKIIIESSEEWQETPEAIIDEIPEDIKLEKPEFDPNDFKQKSSGSRTPPHNWKGKSGWMLEDDLL